MCIFAKKLNNYKADYYSCLAKKLISGAARS